MSGTNKRKNLICALDIGTTKVAYVMSAANSKGLEIIGVGSAPNLGMRHGSVVNIDVTAEAIRKAREEAELMSGQTSDRAWVSIGGTHIQSFDSCGMIAIRNEEVTREDVNRVIEVAKAVAIPSDRQVLHVLPKDYEIDEQQGITDPIGMSGVRLECSVHIVTGNKSIIQNLMKCVEKAHIKTEGLVLQQLASAQAVLSKDEKNLGVTVVDIGGGTTDVITFCRGSVVHTAVIPVGGNNFTHDVAMGLRTTQINAEDLKKKSGCAIPDMVSGDESLEVESVGGRGIRTVPRSSLCKIIEARAEETLKLVHKDLTKHNLVGQLGSGIVLTGGGSELAGVPEMGDFVFDVPARLGIPVPHGGLTDIVRSMSFATAVGLIMHGYEAARPKILETEAEEEDSISLKISDMSRKVKELFTRSL